MSLELQPFAWCHKGCFDVISHQQKQLHRHPENYTIPLYKEDFVNKESCPLPPLPPPLRYIREGIEICKPDFDPNASKGIISALKKLFCDKRKRKVSCQS